VDKAFRNVARDANLSDVTPHVLRHTAATWQMQLGTDPWQAAEYLGMSLKTLLENYGHHHPDYLSGPREALTLHCSQASRQCVHGASAETSVRRFKPRIWWRANGEHNVFESPWTRFYDPGVPKRASGLRRVIAGIVGAAKRLR
jgi:Phage integrase family